MTRTRPRARHGWRLAGAALLLVFGGLASAAGLQVAPTTVEVPSTRSAGGLTLMNNGSRPLTAQTRVFSWTQVDGEDVLEPTTDLAISPPMLELPAGATQLLRVIRLGPPPQQEASYRVIVDELPLDGGTDSDGAALRFVLRYSVPVFIAPADGQPTAPMLHARVTVADDGDRQLELQNLGNGRAQVAGLAYVAPDGERVSISPGLAGYVLPGRQRRWPLPDRLAAPSGGSFEARINGEPSARTLALDP